MNGSTQCDIVSSKIDNEIDCTVPEKSKFILDFNVFFGSFRSRLANLHLNGKTTNEIYMLCSELVNQTQIFNAGLLEEDPEADPMHVLSKSTEYICDKLHENQTAYHRKTKCNQNKFFVEPKELSLGVKWEMLRDKVTKISTPKQTQCKFQYISIVETLQALFKREDFRKTYWEYNSNLRGHVCTEGTFEDFCCGRAFSKNQLFQSYPQAIRLHLSNDDFEICNPLGSKATMHKLSAFYFTVQNMPPQFRFKSDNIFLFCICYADDLKTEHTDINDIWRLVVRDIAHLETIGIDTEGGENLKGTIAYISFDNLGINLAYGLVACFKAHFFCRFCVMPIKDCRFQCREDRTKRRTIYSYNEILNHIENSVNIDVKETRGIKMKCVLNELQHFHILKNLSVDPMHDLNEGIVPFALKQLFKCIIQFKILPETQLIKKIQYFDHGFLNQRNIPSQVNFDKSNLGQNATQSRCLLQNTPFIFWEFHENEQLKEVWICIKSLLRIFTICYSPRITQAQIISLREEIYTHLTSLKNLGLTFIAKHHILTHYPSIMEEMGPLVWMCMFAFERKHKLLKALMKNNSNFTNVTHTISRKHQEHLCEVTDSFTEKFIFGKPKNFPLSLATLYADQFIETAIEIEDMKQEVNFLKYCNYYYKQGLFIFEEGKFHEIQHILKIGNKFYMICIQFHVLLYNDFLNSVEIAKTVDPIYTLIEFFTLKQKTVYEKRKLDGRLYIICDSISLINSVY